GVTTFNVPDLRGRVVAGYDDNAATGRLTFGAAGIHPNVMGAAGGAQTHTLTTHEMPVHSHNVNDSGHSHFYYFRPAAFTTNNEIGPETVHYTSVADTMTSVSFTGITIQSAGSGLAHNNV